MDTEEMLSRNYDSSLLRPPQPRGSDETVQRSDSHTRSRRARSAHSSRRREHIVPSDRDISLSLPHEEQASRTLKKMLQGALQQLEAERRRATDAEGKVRELASSLREVNDAKILALQEAKRANGSLNLYKEQLREAQNEIHKAQGILERVERQRLDAEREAADARTVIRKLNQERDIHNAREEGKRIGMQEGLARGRDLGFQEGRMMRYARTISDGDDDEYEDPEYYENFEVVTRSTTPDYEHPSRFIAQPEPEPRPPSIPREIPPPTPVPIPPPAPPTESNASIRPRSVSNFFRTPHHAPIDVPPDGFIPELGRDSIIRLPPPHELSRPTPSPEPQQPLPSTSDDEPIMIPPHRISRYAERRSHRHSSPESASTTLSQMDMVNDPVEKHRSPMSVIPEVPSPNPPSFRGGQDLRHQSSWAGSSAQRSQMHTPRSAGTPVVPAQYAHYQDRYHVRRDSSSNTSSSEDVKTPSSMHSTLPDINIQPPSRPTSLAPQTSVLSQSALSPTDAQRDVPLPRHHQPSTSGSVTHFGDFQEHPTGEAGGYDRVPDNFVATGFTPNQDLAHFPVYSDKHEGHSDMPGGYQNLGMGMQMSNEPPPVIPDQALFNDDNDSVSSGMSSASVDTLTTPRTRRNKLPPSQGQGSTIYTGTTVVGGSAVPLPPSSVGGNYKGKAKSGSAYGSYSNGGSVSGKTPANGSRSLSRATNRSHG